jgi:hypothetical protein
MAPKSAVSPSVSPTTPESAVTATPRPGAAASAVASPIASTVRARSAAAIELLPRLTVHAPCSSTAGRNIVSVTAQSRAAPRLAASPRRTSESITGIRGPEP